MHLISTNEVFDSYFSTLKREKNTFWQFKFQQYHFCGRFIPPTGLIQVNSPQIVVKMS